MIALGFVAGLRCNLLWWVNPPSLAGQAFHSLSLPLGPSSWFRSVGLLRLVRFIAWLIKRILES